MSGSKTSGLTRWTTPLTRKAPVTTLALAAPTCKAAARLNVTVALVPALANAQHYEVPAAFYRHFDSMDELEEAARDGRLAKLRGFGAKTAEQVLQGIAFARMRESQFLLPVGIEAGELIRERLAAIAEVQDADPLLTRTEASANDGGRHDATKPASVAGWQEPAG